MSLRRTSFSRKRADADRELSRTRAHARLAVLEAELREARNRETASSEILQLINSSSGNLAPVFDAILDKAMQLCEAAFGIYWSFDGQSFETKALGQVPPAYADALRGPQVFSPATAHGRIVRGEPVAHIPDITAEALFRSGDPHRKSLVELGRARTLLLVPLRKDDVLLGAFQLFRQEVRPFSDDQISLVHHFAAQAIVAIENARLITETREGLEQQTATAMILRVISSSPTDVQPTFEAIAAAAKTLSDASLGAVITYDGSLMHWAAGFGWTPDEDEKIRSVFPIPADRGTTTGRAILTRQVAHIADMSADPEYGYRALADSGGHTALAVPMLRDSIPIGTITVQRRRVELFTDKQIDLLKTFADQAVIAIENVRLFNE